MRAFIAFELPDGVRGELAAVSSRLQRQLAGTPWRWVPPENMHLTLQFLGEVEEAQMNGIVAAMQAAAADHAPMPVHLDGLGAFPNPRRPRVLWAGLAAPPGLAELQAKLSAVLDELGFPPERSRFTPHLTLARARGQAAPGVAEALTAEAPQRVSAALSEIVLFESQLKRGGAVYNPLVRAPLRSEG